MTFLSLYVIIKCNIKACVAQRKSGWLPISRSGFRNSPCAHKYGCQSGLMGLSAKQLLNVGSNPTPYSCWMRWLLLIKCVNVLQAVMDSNSISQPLLYFHINFLYVFIFPLQHWYMWLRLNPSIINLFM